MDVGEAEVLAAQIAEETGLATVVGHDGDGSCWVDVDLPPRSGEGHTRLTAHDPDDWPWLYETHVRARLEG